MQRVEIPVPPMIEEIAAVVQELKLVQRTVEHVPVPQIMEETVEVALVPHERGKQRTVDVPMPQVLEETVEVVRLASHERVQQRTAEQFVDVPQILEENVDVVRLVPQERVSKSFRRGFVNRSWTFPFRKFMCRKPRAQLQLRAISNEIQVKYSGKEEFLTEKQEFRMQSRG